MAYESFRNFINALDKAGEFVIELRAAFGDRCQEGLRGQRPL